MSELNFKDGAKIVDSLLKINLDEQNVHSKEDAFILLINNTEYENLSNLCEMIYSSNDLSFASLKEVYELTQTSYSNLDFNTKSIILESAYKCIESGKTLGDKTINDGKINTSSWFSHSLYMGKLCFDLARILCLNEEVAFTLGILHDIGRKYDHCFNHVIKGCEFLYSIGWHNEAIGCLTHSFVNGGRCSNNEASLPGFYVDENGNPKWEIGAKIDDVGYFLNHYDYTDYDRILNIADLMATDKGIVSPYDRIEDIATRRKIDPINRGYFLSDFTNLLIDFMKRTASVDEDYPYIKATKNIKIEEINEKFKIVSQYFYDFYLNKIIELNIEKTIK